MALPLCVLGESGADVQSLSAAESYSVSAIRMRPIRDYASSLPKILQFAMLQIVCLPCGRRRYELTPYDQL